MLRAQDTTAPLFVSSQPASGAAGVSTTSPIRFTFDEPMDADPGNIDVFFVTAAFPPTALEDFDYSWSPDQLTLTCAPSAPLPANTMITWVVGTGFLDLAGNELEAEAFGFFTSSSGSGNGSGSGTNAVTQFAVTQVHHYRQTSPGPPALDLENGYLFIASTILASNRTATGVAVELPTGSAVPLLRSPVAAEYFYHFDMRTNRTEFETAYPAGDYVFTVTAATSNQTATVTFPPGDHPAAPRIANYDAAQAVDPAMPFTLAWDPYPNPTDDDYITVNVGGVFKTACPGETNCLTGSATSVVIPAGVLSPNTTYETTVEFARLILDTTRTDYHTGVDRDAQTAFELKTIGAGGPQAPILTNLVSNAGMIQFEVVAAPGQALVVERASSLAPPDWVPVLSTNPASGTITFLEPLLPTARERFYRASSAR